MISFSQAAYVQKIVKCFGMEDAKPLSIPITLGHNLSKSQSPISDLDIEGMRDVPYKEAVSCCYLSSERIYAVTAMAGPALKCQDSAEVHIC